MASPGDDTEPDVLTWDNVYLGASNKDFARLVPHSPTAQRLFSDIARRLEKDPDEFHHVRRFVHYEPTVVEGSTSGTSFAAGTTPPSQEDDSAHDFCGYYRLNMNIPPANLGLGWVLGSSRPSKPDDFVDFLLAPFSSQHGLHSRHYRLRRLLETSVLLAVSDSRKVSVDGKPTLQRDPSIPEEDENNYQTSLEHRTNIRLGDSTYLLVFTDLNEDQQKMELEDALQKFGPGPRKSVMLLSPTPSKPIIDYHGYSIFDANRHGTTSTVSMGYAQSSGKAVAVKMIKCHSGQYYSLRREISILGLLDHKNVCKLEKVVNFDHEADPSRWRQDEGPTVGLITSPPATAVALGLLASWKHLPTPTAFLGESMRQIASGLEYIHGLGIMHQTSNPTTSSTATYINERKTQSIQHKKGTIPYLAPEVMRIKLGKSNEPFSFPSDVWSLGVTLLDFLSEKKVNRDLGTELCYRWLESVMKANIAGQHYSSLWSLVQMLLAWKPEQRPSAGILAKHFLAPTPPEEPRRPETDGEAPSKRQRPQSLFDEDIG